MTTMSGSSSVELSQVVAAVGEVQLVPYVWPGDPSSESVLERGVGTCASKHALLAERLDGLGVPSRPMFVLAGLVPPSLADVPALAGSTDLLEVHEFLSVSVPGVGPCRVDVTWDPALLAKGLPGTVDWDGRSDMALAVGEASEFWAPDPAQLRPEKEALRARLYGPGERERRDGALAAMSELFATWRAN